MQRQDGEIVLQDQQCVANERIAFHQVIFDSGLVDQVVEFRIGMAPVVAVAAAAAIVDRRVQRELQGVECIRGGRAPTQQIKTGVESLQLAEIIRGGDDIRRDLDADLRQHRRDGLAYIGGRLVVAAIQGDVKPARIAGVGQQFPCFLAIQRQTDIGVPGVALLGRRDDGADRHRQVTHHLAADRLDVDGVGNGPPDAHILERIFLFHAGVQQFVAMDIKCQVLHALLGAFDDFHIGPGFEARDVLRRRIVHEIHFAGKQGRGACRIGFDRQQDHFGDIAFLRARVVPPLRVGHQYGAHIGLALFDHEGSGAVGMA